MPAPRPRGEPAVAHADVRHRAPPRAAGVPSCLRRVEGLRQPAARPSRALDVRARKPFHLVDRRGGRPARRPRAASRLRRAAQRCQRGQGDPDPMSRRLLPLVIAAAFAGALALPGSASAEACPAGLTVVGIAVTGADCVDTGAGGIEIDTPRLLTNQFVEIRGKMNLNIARTQLRQKTAGVPLVAAVKNASGNYTPMMLGTYTVGNFEVCELFKGFTPPSGFASESLVFENTPVVTNDRLDIQHAQIGCVVQPAIDVTQPAFQLATKLLGMKTSITPVFETNNGV